MQKRAVVNVEMNSVLGQDVLWQRKLLIAKGTVLNNRYLTLLKNRGVQFVYIEQPTVQQEEQQPSSLVMTTNILKDLELLNAISIEQAPNISNPHNIFEQQYIDALTELNPEVRYGRSVHYSEEIQSVRSLFVKYMENEQYAKQLNALKEKDYYTYLHAVDVFTLSMLFMRDAKFEHYERDGIGFLLHDIGKVKTPDYVLKKQGKLTKPEFDIMQRHTIDGYDILRSIGAEHIAYLALSHHERIDGTGYPNQEKLLELREEIRLLQLVDMYSAITLTRSYKSAKTPVEAIQMMFQNKSALDEQLLIRLVEFLGIYPPNAFVMLSDGSHAVVESVNEMLPLLPTVRVFQTGYSFMLPIDYRLVISKLISYNTETPDQLFLKFSEYLINCDEVEIDRYYTQLKDHYRSFEWFTHVFIPIYHIFVVLKEQKVLEECRLKRAAQHLRVLLMKTILQLRLLNDKNVNVFVIVNAEQFNPILVQLFEGLLHTEGLYSIVLSGQEHKDEIVQQMQGQQVSTIFLLGANDEYKHAAQLGVNVYSLEEEQLYQLLLRLASGKMPRKSLLQEMERHLSKSALLMK